MLDFFTIIRKSGLVLWYYAFQDVKGNFTDPVNAFIKSVLLQERGSASTFTHGNIQMKWMLDNEFELMFVVGYQKVLSLSYVDKLISDVHLSFRDRYRQELLAGTLAAITMNFDYKPKFMPLLKNAENTRSRPTKMKGFEESKKSQKTVDSLILDKKKDTSKADKKNADAAAAKSAAAVAQAMQKDEEEEAAAVQKRRDDFFRKKTPKPTKQDKKKKAQDKQKGKQRRVWDEGKMGAKDAAVLDYSNDSKAAKAGGGGGEGAAGVHTEEERGWVNSSRALEDLVVEEEEEEDCSGGKAAPKKNGFFAALSSLVGSKALDKEALKPVLKNMKYHLIGKNVAAEIAEKMCDSVSARLEGKVLGTFDTIASTVKQSLNESLIKILTPKRRVDILRDVLESQRTGRPYVITFCGVNGVGKSTNLAKITFWLMKNGFNVLIAACDTFRSGAVEQLRTHQKRLNHLYPVKKDGDKQRCHLFEQGYGKDDAHIAQQAIHAARADKYDVVMIDTAGRMQNNEPLMRSLCKIITTNKPDLVLFVGEALVGNEAVDQLERFDQALADYSMVDDPHCIDGIVLTKFDTIDDKVGAAISMTYTTGQPIVFVGTGQSYPDLKSLNPKSVVTALLK